jgi:VanZ family protein
MPTDSTPAAAASAAARWTPPFVWVVIILIGTSWPSVSVGPDVQHLDKVVHFSAYAVLSALILRATLTLREVGTVAMVIAMVSVFGAVDEWHQSFIPGRSMSFADWIADSTGALVGALALRFIPFLTPRRPGSPS